MRAVALLLFVACRGEPEPSAALSPVDVGVTLATVPAHGFEPTSLGTHPLVVVTPEAIVVDGKPLVRLVNGAVDPAQKADGFRITKLTSYLGQLPRGDELLLGLHEDTSVQVLLEVVASAIQPEAGWRKVGLLARAGGRLVRLPLAWPARVVTYKTNEGSLFARGDLDRNATARQIEQHFLPGLDRCYQQAFAAEPLRGGQLRFELAIDPGGEVTAKLEATSMDLPSALGRCFESEMSRWRLNGPGAEHRSASWLPLTFTLDPARKRVALLAESPGMFVSVTKEALILWSVTREEGDLSVPKLVVPHKNAAALRTLSSTLAEIVDRRWPSGQRPFDATTIVVQPEGDVPMRILAPLLGALRATPDGKSLFPDVRLVSAFE